MRHWWIPLVLLFAIGGTGLVFMGVRTYQDAPPIPTFTAPDGAVVVTADTILDGQETFQRYGLMDHGSMFGDGAGRGPDYTADALHRIAVSVNDHHRRALADNADADLLAAARTRLELKANTFEAKAGTVRLTAAQTAAFAALERHYVAWLCGDGPDTIQPAGYVRHEQEARDLTAFFFWGAWVCAARRPGHDYSYTHNWPYDELAGNTPSAPVTFWSVFGALALVLGVGVVLYVYGRFDQIVGWSPQPERQPLTVERLGGFRPSPTQRATWKFFVVAACLFLIQVLAGVLTIHDFVGFTRFFGVDLAAWLPITITRSWHLLLSLFWISACWIAASIFVLPLIAGPEPPGQLRLVNALFWLLIVIVGGSVVGTLLGPKGLLGEWWRSLGHQGWEFVELGKVWQGLLLLAFLLWAIVVGRGLWPVLRQKRAWSLPYWLLGSITAILLLSLSGFVAGPRTNFAIADFWRWMVIHMWVEAFFEVFTTAIVAYFMFLMGLVSQNAAARVVYLAAILFLGSGLLGISHNFYWNAKPVETLAIGSVFSTLQVVPLILLTLEAWRFRRMPQVVHAPNSGRNGRFGQGEAFLFLIAVNFWNFLGAGVFGFIINLPIVNYYEHGTWLTVNHGHAALMGVYGNLSVAALLFCGRHLLAAGRWNGALLHTVFWSLNLGLGLMVLCNTLPAGVLQLDAVLERGFWYARSQEFIGGTAFQTAAWLRLVGGATFVVGGVLPLCWFCLTRCTDLKATGPALPAPATDADAGAVAATAPQT